MAMFRDREVLPTQLELLKRQTREGAIIFFFSKVMAQKEKGP